MQNYIWGMINSENSGWPTLWGLLQEDSCSAEEAGVLGCYVLWHVGCCLNAIPKHRTLKLVAPIPPGGTSGITLRICKRPKGICYFCFICFPSPFTYSHHSHPSDPPYPHPHPHSLYSFLIPHRFPTSKGWGGWNFGHAAVLGAPAPAAGDPNYLGIDILWITVDLLWYCGSQDQIWHW